MEENKDTVVTEEPKENLFTQADVSNVVAKNVKEERAKLLKELGIEDVENAKAALKAYREHQEQQKSDLEKLNDSLGLKDIRIAELESKLKAHETEQKLNNILTELKIDTAYHKTVAKLVSELPEDSKEAKELVMSTVKEYLPGVIEGKDFGVEGKEKKPVPGNKQLLDQKYKNNPWYKG